MKDLAFIDLLNQLGLHVSRQGSLIKLVFLFGNCFLFGLWLLFLELLPVS